MKTNLKVMNIKIITLNWNVLLATEGTNGLKPKANGSDLGAFKEVLSDEVIASVSDLQLLSVSDFVVELSSTEGIISGFISVVGVERGFVKADG